MKKLSPTQEEELLRYLDGELNEHENAVLTENLKKSSELRARLDELRVVRNFLVRKASLDQPGKNFTLNVLEGLDAPQARAIFSYKKGLILLLGIIIASALALTLLLNGVFDQSTTSLVVDATKIQNQWVKTPSFTIPFNAKILVNGIIFLNLAIAMVLLDRTILRPLFQKRMMLD